MPLSISTANTPGLNLVAIIDRVTTSGVLLDPPERWNSTDEIWEHPDVISYEDSRLTLSESPDGLYSQVEEEIDGLTENLRILILINEEDIVLGVYNSHPVETFVAPEVVIDLTVTEDRT